MISCSLHHLQVSSVDPSLTTLHLACYKYNLNQPRQEELGIVQSLSGDFEKSLYSERNLCMQAKANKTAGVVMIKHYLIKPLRKTLRLRGENNT